MIKSFQKGVTDTELIVSNVMLMVAVLFGVFMFKTVGGWVSCNITNR